MANCSAHEAAVRASDLAFRRLHGGREYRNGEPYDVIGPREASPYQHIVVINAEEAEHADLEDDDAEDDDAEDETEERSPGKAPGRKIAAARRVLQTAGR